MMRRLGTFAQNNGFRLALAAAGALSMSAVDNGAEAAFITYNGTTGAEAAWQAAAGTTVLENFEGYAAGTQISGLPALGLGFDTLAGGGFPVTYSFGGTPHGAMQLANFPNGINAVNRWDDIVMHVLPGYTVTALGFWNGDGQNAVMNLYAYDASNNLLGSVGALKGTFAGFTSDVAVARFVFGGNTGDGWNHIDGLQTNAAPASAVPEPSTMLLLGGGLAGLGIAGLRKRLKA